ncbi:MAG: hypothetical protein ACRYGI_07045 [Janthinobacterium lividum]
MAWKNAVFPKSRWQLISQGKSATQSSTAHDRSLEGDAATIINRRLLGASQNHTDLEDSPWWQIDFGETRMIHETRLFNRLDDVLDRIRRFEIVVLENKTDWKTAFVRNEPSLFSGVDETPFVRVPEEGFAAGYGWSCLPGNVFSTSTRSNFTMSNANEYSLTLDARAVDQLGVDGGYM